jgi:hypothetical protein
VLPAQRAGPIFNVPRPTGRNDGANHAIRFAASVTQQLFAQGYGLAFELSGQAAEVSEHAGGTVSFRPGLRSQRVAGFERDQSREVFVPGLKRVTDPLQHAPAFARRHLAPGLERFGCSMHRTINVLGLSARDFGNDPALSRILDCDGFAGSGLYPCAVDEHARAQDLVRCRGWYFLDE